MNTGTTQKITIAAFIALFFVLYYGCEKTSIENRLLEKSREIQTTSVNIDQEIAVTKRMISKDNQADVESYLIDLEEGSSDEQKIEALKNLAGKWYNLGYPLISGHYAEKIAEISNTEEAWGMAGTTNYLALTNANSDEHRKYAQEKAISALEKAISLNPSNLDHQINKALCFVESDAPMQGILMLRDLATEHPDNIPAQIQLGRLSMRTNQWEKALERFEKVLSLDSNNKEAHCYLVDVYKAQNDMVKAGKSAEICQNDK